MLGCVACIPVELNALPSVVWTWRVLIFLCLLVYYFFYLFFFPSPGSWWVLKPEEERRSPLRIPNRTLEERSTEIKLPVTHAWKGIKWDLIWAENHGEWKEKGNLEVWEAAKVLRCIDDYVKENKGGERQVVWQARGACDGVGKAEGWWEKQLPRIGKQMWKSWNSHLKSWRHMDDLQEHGDMGNAESMSSCRLAGSGAPVSQEIRGLCRFSVLCPLFT